MSAWSREAGFWGKIILKDTGKISAAVAKKQQKRNMKNSGLYKTGTIDLILTRW